jgi:hypothetical protein
MSKICYSGEDGMNGYMKWVPAFLAMVLALSLTLCFSSSAVAGNPVQYQFTATTPDATNVSVASATLNGCFMMSPANQNNPLTLSGYFKYGLQPGALNMTTAQQQVTIAVGQSSRCFSQAITGLSPCTTYYAQAVIFSNVAEGPSANSFLAMLVNPFQGEMRGIGVGFEPAGMGKSVLVEQFTFTVAGNVISFDTPGCKVSRPGQASTGAGAGTSPSWALPPVQMSNIVVQSAAIATPRVSPGQQVDITASVANNGGSNGDARVTLYVNGQEVESKGVTVSSGQTTPVHFTVSRNEPGTYSVYVSGVSAGNFTVDLFTNNDILIYGLIALFTLGIAGTLYLVTRKRTA